MDDMASPRDRARGSFLKESAYMRVSSPLFSELTRRCADDPDMLELATATRRGQSVGQLLPCAAQYLLFKSPDPRLARYFPSMTETPDPASEAFAAFREFCLDRRVELTELLASRTANTNLVEKASCLLPAIRYVDQLSSSPLTLLEICCSAGLNLLFDEYHYDFEAAGSMGPPESPVRLSCKLVGGNSPPLDSMPRVARRLGIDLVKVDPSSAHDRLWMEAVLCPEWRAERDRLRSALTLRQAHDLQVIIADALEALPPLLEELPGTLCLLQTYCMGHWSSEAKAALEDLLRRASRHREIHRVGLEMPDREPPQAARARLATLAAAGIPLLQKSFPSRIEHTWYRNGAATVRLLGQADGFGLWVDWCAT